MAEMKNICGKIPMDLHEKVREEIELTESSTQKFLQQVIEEHFNRVEGKGEISMGAVRTVAVQVSEELFQRLKTVIAKKGMKQKDFLIQIIEEALEKAPVILPQKRNYWIETTYSQYAHAHHKKDMDLVRSILKERYPEYVRAFDDVMERTAGHRFNMFVMRRDLLDHYCTWLFDVLDRAERQINLSEYDEYNKRVFGFLSERLLDVWVETNHISYTEMPVVFMESQHWLKKGMAFIERKFRKNWT